MNKVLLTMVAVLGLSINGPVAQAGPVGGVEKGTKEAVGGVDKGAKETAGVTEKGVKETVGVTEKGLKDVDKGVKGVFHGTGKAIKKVL